MYLNVFFWVVQLCSDWSSLTPDAPKWWIRLSVFVLLASCLIINHHLPLIWSFWNMYVCMAVCVNSRRIVKFKNYLQLPVKPTSGGFAPGQRLRGRPWLVFECLSASQSYGRLIGRPPCEWTPQSWCLDWLCRPGSRLGGACSEPPRSHPAGRRRGDSHSWGSRRLCCLNVIQYMYQSIFFGPVSLWQISGLQCLWRSSRSRRWDRRSRSARGSPISGSWRRSCWRRPPCRSYWCSPGTGSHWGTSYEKQPSGWRTFHSSAGPSTGYEVWPLHSARHWSPTLQSRNRNTTRQVNKTTLGDHNHNTHLQVWRFL